MGMLVFELTVIPVCGHWSFVPAPARPLPYLLPPLALLPALSRPSFTPAPAPSRRCPLQRPRCSLDWVPLVTPRLGASAAGPITPICFCRLPCRRHCPGHRLRPRRHPPAIARSSAGAAAWTWSPSSPARSELPSLVPLLAPPCSHCSTTTALPTVHACADTLLSSPAPAPVI
jgi:hypothetical protein